MLDRLGIPRESDMQYDSLRQDFSHVVETLSTALCDDDLRHRMEALQDKQAQAIMDLLYKVSYSPC
jgi:hypothetical protein